jgi:hypothetical protein
MYSVVIYKAYGAPHQGPSGDDIDRECAAAKIPDFLASLSPGRCRCWKPRACNRAVA